MPERFDFVGITVLYGRSRVSATSAAPPVAGERFAVFATPVAVAVVEGVGDHGCGIHDRWRGRRDRPDRAQLRRRNVGGWCCLVLDEAGDFAERCNMAMVELEPRFRKGRHSREAAPPLVATSTTRAASTSKPT